MIKENAEKIVARLTSMGWHIVTMESCTGGGLAIKNSVAGPDEIVGVGITGSLTREDPNNPNSEPGKVYISIYMSGGKGRITYSCEITVDGDDREKGKEEVLDAILDLVLHYLKTKPDEGGLLC